MPVRAGITYRVTYAGLVGAAERADYGCYGPGTNLAARMMQAAGWGQIWLDEAIARRAAAPAHTATTHFTVEPLGARAFKGFAAPQAVFGLQGRRAVGSAARFSGPLAGRRHELAQLTAAIEPPLPGSRPASSPSLGRPASARAACCTNCTRHCMRLGPGRSRRPLRSGRATRRRHRAPSPGSTARPMRFRRYSLGPFRQLVRAYFTQAAAGDAQSREQAGRFIDRLGALIARCNSACTQAAARTFDGSTSVRPSARAEGSPASERSRRGLAEPWTAACRSWPPWPICTGPTRATNRWSPRRASTTPSPPCRRSCWRQAGFGR